jgi:hypothetical protein
MIRWAASRARRRLLSISAALRLESEYNWKAIPSAGILTMVTRLTSRDGRAIEVAEIVAAVGEAPSGLGFWATGVTKKKTN